MREIKFEVLLRGKHFGYEQINEFGDWEWTCTELNPVNKINWTKGVMVGNPDFVRRQFTGLHDKNGKEIFEGDIVTLSGSPHKEILNEFKYIVCFENGSFVCNHQNKEHGRWGLLSRAFDADIKRLGELSVTGTIYDK